VNINATLLGQAITFGILIWFTMKFVWPPLMTAMQERQSRIAEGLAAAEKAKHDLELAEARAKEMLRESKQQASDIQAQAQQRANEIIELSKTTAREEGERLVAAARTEIQQEIQRAREQLKGQIATLALAGAEQVLMHEVDKAKHNAVLDRLVAQL
jgi:F-type H+-transporting ATPase subunit b